MIRVTLATAADRERIYEMRHAVYSSELGQHAANPEGRLTDPLDAFNEYIVARRGDEILGFVSVTPPNQPHYSVDKYFPRASVPFPFDASLFEVRLLTVANERRGFRLAALLMYAAYRRIAAQGGARIVAIGRRDLRGFYAKFGLEPIGLEARAGAVTYELMTAPIERLRALAVEHRARLRKWAGTIRWELEMPFLEDESCFHGGASFEAIGVTFADLDRRESVVNADVLDAWFPPAPGAVSAIQKHLSWLLRTSPPQDGLGLVQTIARERTLPIDSIAIGAGSSSLIYLAFQQYLTARSRVLLPDPTYGEYAHVFDHIIGCRTEVLSLAREHGFRIDPEVLIDRMTRDRLDLIVIVNPNNPTGRRMRRAELERVCAAAPAHTRIWIDEAYIDFAASGESLENFAARSANVIVCKSLSKAYGLSGARVAYLCGPPALMKEIRRATPPWAVSLPAQVAAVAALQDPAYYAVRYSETALLRDALATTLVDTIPGIEIVGSCANFLLCELPADGPDAAAVCEACRVDGVFLRDAGRTSRRLGRYALRIAVKDRADNARIVRALARAMGQGASA